MIATETTLHNRPIDTEIYNYRSLIEQLLTKALTPKLSIKGPSDKCKKKSTSKQTALFSLFI